MSRKEKTLPKETPIGPPNFAGPPGAGCSLPSAGRPDPIRHITCRFRPPFALDQQGESGTAALLHQLGGVAETARDLAYRLYTVCERKKWADEAQAYNSLAIAWPKLTRLAQAERGRANLTQRSLEF